MPSEYLVEFKTRQIDSKTSRGDGSRQDHSQTITYHDHKDTQNLYLKQDKVVETVQEHIVAPYKEQTTRRLRSIQVTFTVSFKGLVIGC